VPFGAPAQNPTTSPDTSREQVLKAAELDALVAPIALYPDNLLAQVLMASTYPLEVVQAERWVTENKQLEGDRLKTEAEKQPWDDSVKSLVATPAVLSMMSTKLDWTQKLGDAVLAQQADVMDSIQRLRSKAQANNNLQSTKEQRVTVREENNRQVIAIEPAASDTLYVPYYDPAVVYGEWPYPDYPPYYFSAPGYVAPAIVGGGLAFGAAYALGRWASAGRYWGGGINWSGRQIDINRGAHVAHWQHNPQHRRGVRYNNAGVQQRFGNAARAANAGRGQSGQQAHPDRRRDAGAERGSGHRASAGKEARNQAKHAKGPSSADRAKAADRGRSKQASRGYRPSSHAQRPAQKHASHHARPHRVASRPSHHGRASLGGPHRGGGAVRRGGGGRAVAARGGGRRRSDIRLKYDIHLLGRLDNGIGFYRFRYHGSSRSYVGVMAQEVARVMPDAVVREPDGYLSVRYDRLGVKFQSYQRWIASGARAPHTPRSEPADPRD
jgi:hypothetical protein